MARAQLLIEGFTPQELIDLARHTSLLPLFEGKPVAVTYGKVTLMGGVRKRGTRLLLEVGEMQAGAEKILVKLEPLVQQIARLRGIKRVEWKLP
jgi:hypothetical protein